MRRVILRMCFVLFVLAVVAYAGEYSSQELALIKWGEEEDALQITEPAIEGAGTEEEFTEPGLGPRVARVDENENFIFSSTDLGYLKGFDNNGQLIFNLLEDDTPIKHRLGGRTVGNFLVNSSWLYIVGANGLPVVPIVDYEGNIVDSLVPYPWDPLNQVYWLSLNCDNSITVDRIIMGRRESTRRVITYADGQFFNGGSTGFLASNGSYYSVRALYPSTLVFNKYENPDTAGVAATRQFTEVEFPDDSISASEILNGGGGNNLYVYIRKLVVDYFTFEVWEFDLEYNLLAKAIFPPAENKYDWFITPFVSRDGSIYEFRCLDDGVHVVKWTKE